MFTRRATLPLLASPLLSADLNAQFAALQKSFDGRLGVAAQRDQQVFSHLGQDRFSIQSVMKLFVGFAICDLIDQGKLRLDTPATFRYSDKSVFMQPIAKLLKNGEYKTTIGDLIRRGIIDSDSAAADYLILHHLGQASAITQTLQRKGIDGIRVDRTERDLQTQVHGLTWKSDYLDEAALDRALAAQPKDVITRSYTAYRKDPRDTATPLGSIQFLSQLAAGKLLQPNTTRFLLQAMRDCATGEDRLKAGLTPGWTVGHKTGTSSAWQGIRAATNDIGLLFGPQGQTLAVAVYVADSRADEKTNASIIAKSASTTISALG
jgi:beta-lactamase class A